MIDLVTNWASERHCRDHAMPGKKGLVTDNGVDDLIQHDVNHPHDADDLLTTVRTQGLDVLERDPDLP
jgi:hypothetical protein